MRIKYALLTVMLLLAVFIAHNKPVVIEPEHKSLSGFPRVMGQWRTTGDTMFDVPTMKVLRPTDYLMRTYSAPGGQQLSLYVGYHNGGKASGPIHSPRNCLPGTGWYLAEDKEMTIMAGGKNLRLIRARFAKGGQNLTCYYWYQVRGRNITTDMGLKLSVLTGMLLERRKDASFIRIDLLESKTGNNEEFVMDFLQNAYPLLSEYLPA